MPDTRDQLKRENEALIRSWGGDVNEWLPLIDDVTEVAPQEAHSIAARACALGYVAALGFGAPAGEVRAALMRFDLWPSLSRREASLFERPSLSDQERVDCTWLIEAVQALAWCVGIVDMDHRRVADADLSARLKFREDPSALIAGVRLRPLHEIQRQCDLLYRLHWYARNSSLVGRSCIVSESVVRERRRAVDWAYGVEADWDEVPGDT
jgi:hypothetical protein